MRTGTGKINWNYNEDPYDLADDYMCVQVASGLKNEAQSILKAINDGIGFKALDSKGNEIEDEFWEVGSSYISEGYRVGNLVLTPKYEGSEVLYGYGFDGKVFTQTGGSNFVDELLWSMYDDEGHSLPEVDKALDDLYWTDALRQTLSRADIEAFVDVTVDEKLQLRYEGLRGIIRGCNLLITRISSDHNAARRNSEDENTSKTGKRYFWVQNDWWGLICCELIGENDKAYYFKYETDQEVILPKWRVLKGSNRVKYETSEADAASSVGYFPGGVIFAQNGQVFRMYELKDLSKYLEWIRTLDEFEIVIDYGPKGVYMEDESGVTSASEVPAFNPKGIKGWGVASGHDDADWYIAGTARIADYTGSEYTPQMDTPDSMWTVTFKS